MSRSVNPGKQAKPQARSQKPSPKSRERNTAQPEASSRTKQSRTTGKNLAQDKPQRSSRTPPPGQTTRSIITKDKRRSQAEPGQASRLEGKLERSSRATSGRSASNQRMKNQTEGRGDSQPSQSTYPKLARKSETRFGQRRERVRDYAEDRAKSNSASPAKPEADTDVLPQKRPSKRAHGARLAASQPVSLGPQRLQKVLAAAGITSRRQAEEIIVAGRVRVNGRIVRKLGSRVDPEQAKITVDGEPLQVQSRVYFLLNKPDGVVCSAEGSTDPRQRPTVLSLLPGVKERIYPVGRLDYHSRGALILTNDGDFAAMLTHPGHGVTKTYHVKFQGQLSLDELAQLEQGVTLEDRTRTLPLVELSVIRETQTNTWVQMVLRQGLYRQIRRMGEAIHHSVLKIIRVAIGPITADGLADGEFRPLTPGEIYELRVLSNTRSRTSRKPSGVARTVVPR